MSNEAILNNDGRVDTIPTNLYYPRLQVNKHGEIVLATGKKGSLTTGILIGTVDGSPPKFPLGKKFDDWEVGGELVDYDGEVQVLLRNKVPAAKHTGALQSE